MAVDSLIIDRRDGLAFCRLIAIDRSSIGLIVTELKRQAFAFNQIRCGL